MSNRPFGESCELCRFFAETVDEPTPVSDGECVINPIPFKPIRRTYWCGQFKPAVEFVQ